MLKRIFYMLAVFLMGAVCASLVWMTSLRDDPISECSEVKSVPWPVVSKPRFVGTAHYPESLGYTHVFRTDDDRDVIESMRGFHTIKEARDSFREQLRNLTIVQQGKDSWGETYVAVNQKGQAFVLSYPGGQGYEIILAPDLELANEFRGFRVCHTC